MSFNTYINKVLKQVHPDTGITGEAMAEMNHLVNITLDKTMGAINRIIRNRKVRTLTTRDVQFGVRLAWPGELAKHAVSEGVKAVTKYGAESNEGGRKGAMKSKSVRAGLTFPVTRVSHEMRIQSVAPRLAEMSAVYMAATLEYICAEILELSGNSARDNKRVRITPRNIMLALVNDEELAKLFRDVVISGGVQPNIRQEIIPTAKEAKRPKKIKVAAKTKPSPTEPKTKPATAKPKTKPAPAKPKAKAPATKKRITKPKPKKN